MIVLVHTSQGGGHECLAEPYNIANHDAATLVQMMRRDLYGGRLEIEELVTKIFWGCEIQSTRPVLLVKGGRRS